MPRKPVTDKEQREQDVFEALKAELRRGFGASESSHVPLTAKEVIERNRA